MCGRFTLRARLNDLLAEYALKRALEYEPRDFRPTNEVPIVRVMNGEREMMNAVWWLIPPWQETPKPNYQYPTFNARVETIAEKPTFREPFKKRRCLVLTDGWYEWKVVGGTEKNPVKQQYMMHFPDQRPFALAGLWEKWEKKGEVVESCTVIVRDPTPALAEFHSRMPIVLPSRLHDMWLDPEFQEKKPLLDLLEEFEVDEVVGTTIGEPKAARPTKKKS